MAANMHMYDTMDEVKNDVAMKYIIRNCKRYNMPGVFIEYNLGRMSKESGIYFVTGIDRDRIRRQEYILYELMLEQERNFTYFQPVKIFRVTNCDPAVLVTRVALYCWSAEFVKNVFPQYDVPIYEHLLMDEVSSLEKLYLLTHDKKRSEEFRMDAQNRFRSSMVELKKRYSKKGLKGKWHKFRISNRYCWKHGKIRNLVHFLTRKSNKVDIDRVLYNSAGTMNTNMELWKYKEFKKEVKRYPEVIYYPSHSVAISMVESCKPGKTSPKNHKCKYVSIIFPVEAEAHVARAYADAVYKPEAPLTADEIANSGEPFSSVVVPEEDFFHYQSFLTANGVQYAIDNGYINHPTCDEIPFMFYKKDWEKVNAIFFQLCNDMSSFHYIESKDAEELKWLTTMYSDVYEIGELEDEWIEMKEHQQRMDAIKDEQRKNREKRGYNR